MKEDKKTFITSEPVVIPKLPKEDLDELKKELEMKFKVPCNYEKTSYGYLFFISGQDKKIAKLEYDVFNKKYQSLKILKGVKEPEPPYLMPRSQKREDIKRRRFVLKRRALGVAFTATTLAMFVTAGIMKPEIDRLFNEKYNVVKLPNITEGLVFEEDTALNDANDFVAMSWVEYTMDTMIKLAQSGDDEYLTLEVQKIYEGSYSRIISLYNDYFEAMDINVEKTDTLLNAINIIHDQLRKNISQFNDDVRKSPFLQYGFGKSTFASAIVADNEGRLLHTRDDGVVKDRENAPVIYDLSGNDKCAVYVKVQDIPNNTYRLDNCPSDSLMIDGQIYVNSSHINDFLPIADMTVSSPKM